MDVQTNKSGLLGRALLLNVTDSIEDIKLDSGEYHEEAGINDNIEDLVPINGDDFEDHIDDLIEEVDEDEFNSDIDETETSESSDSEFTEVEEEIFDDSEIEELEEVIEEIEEVTEEPEEVIELEEDFTEDESIEVIEEIDEFEDDSEITDLEEAVDDEESVEEINEDIEISIGETDIEIDDDFSDLEEIDDLEDEDSIVEIDSPDFNDDLLPSPSETEEETEEEISDLDGLDDLEDLEELPGADDADDDIEELPSLNFKTENGNTENLLSIDALPERKINSSTKTLPVDILNSDIKWNYDHDKLRTMVRNLSGSLELPAEIFKAAREYFLIKSGIMLTFDSENEILHPFASTGIDQTSLRRCRISSEFLKKKNILMNGDSIFLNLQKSLFTDFFSKRQLDITESFNILVFMYQDKLSGIMIILDSPALRDSHFQEAAYFFISKTSEMMFKNRVNRIAKLSSAGNLPAIDFNDITSNVIDFYERNGIELHQEIKFTLIDYSGIIKSFESSNSLVDTFNIEKDITKLLFSMTTDKDCFLRVRGYRFFIGFFSGLRVTSDILRNQIKTAVYSVFDKNNIDSPPSVSIFQSNINAEELDNHIKNITE